MGGRYTSLNAVTRRHTTSRIVRYTAGTCSAARSCASAVLSRSTRAWCAERPTSASSAASRACVEGKRVSQRHNAVTSSHRHTAALLCTFVGARQAGLSVTQVCYVTYVTNRRTPAFRGARQAARFAARGAAQTIPSPRRFARPSAPEGMDG